MTPENRYYAALLWNQTADAYHARLIQTLWPCQWKRQANALKHTVTVNHKRWSKARDCYGKGIPLNLDPFESWQTKTQEERDILCPRTRK